MSAEMEANIPVLNDEAFRRDEHCLEALRRVADSGTGYFCEGRRQVSDLIGYLIEFGEQPIVLHGPEGVGKTRLLAQQLVPNESSWRIVQLLGRSDLTVPELMVALGDGFGVELQDDFLDVAVKQLAQQFFLLGRQGRRAVLVIDDAELLPADTVEVLMAMYAYSHHQSHTLAMVMLVNESVGASSQAVLASLPVLTIPILPLSIADTQGYIAYLAESSGQPAWQGLEPQLIEGIHQQSGGLPSRINALLQQPHLRMQFRPKTGHSRWLWLLVGAAIAAGVAMVLLQQ